MIANSIENSIVLFADGKYSDAGTQDGTVVGFKYYRSGVDLANSTATWFKWKFYTNVRYHFCVEDQYYWVSTDGFLNRVSLIQETTDTSIDQDDVNYLIHLDNQTTVEGGVHNSVSNITTFTDGTNSCEFSWQSSVTNPRGSLVIVDSANETIRLGRYAEATVGTAGSTFTVPGDWSREVTAITVTNAGSGYTSVPTVTITGGGGSNATATATIASGAITGITVTNAGFNFTSAPTVTISGGGGSSGAATATIHDGKYNIGYLYDYQVEFPRFYPTQLVGEQTVSDIHARLTVHRVKLNFGKIGLYETTIKRVGKLDYTEVYESADLDEYQVSDAPFLEEKIKDIPIYEKNTNIELTLKSAHPAPAVLRALSWEGDYSTNRYRRV